MPPKTEAASLGERMPHKPTVQRAMDLARHFRAAPGSDYDVAYKELETFLYGALASSVSPDPQTTDKKSLTVWFGSMPESNGKRNWTVMLRRKDAGGLLGSIASGVCFYRSEYHGRASYEADRLRYLIGELDKAPDILAYDSESQDATQPVGARLPLTDWPMRGVRVDGDTVIISVKGGNDVARWLCGELVAQMNAAHGIKALKEPT